MPSYIIWGTALLTYAAFWCWYVGFRKKVTPEEAQRSTRLFDDVDSHSSQQIEHLRNFLANDDGKDFVMVNLLQLRKPVADSSNKLDRYQKIFFGALLRKAGHPVMIARAACGNLENIASDQADNWGAAGLIRYRSRRDLMEILPHTIGSEHHGLKLAALEKTLAFPASPWFMLGGPRIVVALATALIAALLQIFVSA